MIRFLAIDQFGISVEIPGRDEKLTKKQIN
jgi:hypothetical protein